MRLVIVSSLALAVSLLGQDEAALQKNMKAIDAHAKVIRGQSARSGAEVADNAEKIGALYGEMKGFWENRNVADAVKASEDGRTAAMELASAAKAGDAEKGEAAFKALNGTCRSCHTAHRERLPDGTYKIK
jgi:cytochrome c556